jgi:hypothetical protein
MNDVVFRKMFCQLGFKAAASSLLFGDRTAEDFDLKPVIYIL